MDNPDIARVLDEVADLLEIQGSNPFRIRAYRAAARIVEGLGEPVSSIVAQRGEKALTELPGIGKDLAHKLAEIAATGDLGVRRELAKEIPEGLLRVMRIGSIGPKRAKMLFDALGVRTVAELEALASSGELRKVRGFGEVLEQRVLEGCRQQKGHGERVSIADADLRARAICDHLRGVPGVTAIEVAGSYRRRRETVGDLDILVASTSGGEVSARLAAHPDVKQVLAVGDTKCSVVLRSGLQVDLRVVEPSTFGAALHYFTGSKAHNIALRTIAVHRGLKVSEYGVFRGEKRIAGRTEEEVFRAVGLPWIPPELRENAGEIEAARAGELPVLVRPEEIRGDLHMHTTWSDGKSSVAEMVEACRARGYAYLAITDHTRAVRVVGGLDRPRFLAQAREIEAARRAYPDITILHGAEVDVLSDGRLDLDEETLAELDVVIASVHKKMDLDEAAMTERVLRALRHPRVCILGHPQGRLLGRRAPIALDMVQVVRAARDLGVLLEVDAQPARLDLDGALIRMAKDAGAKIVIDSDAHHTEQLAFLRHGVDQARRGWCTADDVANTRPVDAFLALLRSRREAPPASARVPRAAARPRPRHAHRA